MSKSYRLSDRRRDQYFTLIERRKGLAWMWGEIAFFVFLLFYLVSHLLK